MDRRRTLDALLQLAGQALGREVDRGLAARGFPEIRPAHAAVFRHLDAEGARLTVLAERAGMTKQSMAYLVEGLEAAGHLRSRPDPRDGRARVIRLTAKGLRVLEALHEIDAEAEARLAGRIGARRAARLRRALDLWAEAMEAEPPA